MKRLSEQDLLQLVEKICNGLYNTEQEIKALHELFKYNVLDPEALDLIYHHKPELTPQEIVEKALSYKPIILPPPKK